MASTKNIHVRLYATYREQAGSAQIDVSIIGDTVADVIAQLIEDVPSLPPTFKPHLIAVND